MMLPDLLEGIVPEGVELQIDLETGCVRCETFCKPRLPGDPDAIGIDHQMTDRPSPRRIEYLEEPRG